MSDLLDFYQQQAAGVFSGIPWLRQLQQNALSEFTRLGFPTRANEDWKYTRVDAFLQHRFVSQNRTTSTRVDASGTDVPIGHKITLQQGAVLGIEGLSSRLPKGIVVCSLAEALVSHADKVKPYLGSVLQTQHGFQALNTASLDQGVFVYIPAGVEWLEPLLLSHWQNDANHAAYVRHLIVAEAGSSASIIEDYQGDASMCYLTNTVTEIHVARDAVITHSKIQRESKLAYHTGHIAVHQAAGSQFKSHSLSLGGKWVRSDLVIDLAEPKASCFMNGIYAPAEGQHVDHHTLVNHLVPDCTSEQDYKGVLTGHSRAVFNGQVMVAKHAQHTVAKQQNKNLLLSLNAEIDTKPQLDIYADDVVCTHGATVGQLDEDALFYLATRGIGRVEASQYLIRAFTVDNFRALPPALSDWMNALFNQSMRGEA